MGKKNFGALWENAGEANILLRAMANENRLMILCLLAEGERSVGAIESMTGARQPTVSQQLARLRADGLVESRRDGKTIYYSLICERTRRVLELLDDLSLQVAGAGAEPPVERSTRQG
jgi:DNA-binding transcriptional ArsR family regulator